MSINAVTLAAALKQFDRLRKVAMAVKRVPALPLAVILLFIGMAVLADMIVPHDPYSGELSKRLLPPFWQQEGSMSYPLGTDPIGRDILSRIIFGTRISLFAAFASTATGGAIGTILGLISGYFGGGVDALIMRAADVMMSFPSIFFAVLLAVVAGPSFVNIIIVVSIVLWARFARQVRGEVLSLKQREFVALAKVAGCGHFRIIMRHIFPNIVPTLLVLTTLQIGWVILLEASLSFLGAGIPPPSPSWGSMVAEGREYIVLAWWVSVLPGVALTLFVMALNFFGDWLRDRLDPKLRQL